jgi:GntR family transcriptional regulator
MITAINLTLDFRNKIPISDQVQTEMRRLIFTGFLHPGDQLPTVRVLASQLQVNFNTIARAYRALDQEGLISTQQGRGTYVLDASSPPEQPIATKEGAADILVKDVLELANSQGISNELIFHSFLRIFQKPGQKIIKPHKRFSRISQKKRVYPPAGDRGWVKTKCGPGLKKTQKLPATNPLHHNLFHVKQGEESQPTQ